MTVEQLLALVPTVQRLEARVAELESKLAGTKQVDPDELLTIDRAAAIRCCSTKTIRRLLKSNALRNYGTAGRLLFRRGDLLVCR